MAEEYLKAIKLTGRGGQGIVTAGELLALAAFEENKHAQAIPHFGAERRGGPAFCSLRISDSPILLKCDVLDADAFCIFDPTIWHFRNMFIGIKPDSILIFNSQKSSSEIKADLENGKYDYKLKLQKVKIYTINATELALEVLHQPIVNTAMMGAFSSATGFVSIESVLKVINNNMKRNVKQNCELAERAYNDVKNG